MITAEDVFSSIENPLAWMMVVSVETHAERVVKNTLQFKVLMWFMSEGRITVDDIYKRLEGLAAKPQDERYQNPDGDAVFMYLLALEARNEPFSEEGQLDYFKGCSLVARMANLGWARSHMKRWASWALKMHNAATD